MTDLLAAAVDALWQGKLARPYSENPCACCSRTGESGGTPPTCWGCLDCNPTLGLHSATCGLTRAQVAFLAGPGPDTRPRTLGPAPASAEQLTLFNAVEAQSAEDHARAVLALGPRPGVQARTAAAEAARAVLRRRWLNNAATASVGWLLWAIAPAHPGRLIVNLHDLPRRCTPTVMSVDTRPDTRGDPGPGELLYRGACLGRGCTWEGPIRLEENAAVEDAHDHALPWWRQLPVVEGPKVFQVKRRTEIDRIVAAYEAAVPGCTSHPMCPIRTWRARFAGRHHDGGLLGGYDLGEHRPDPQEATP